MSNVLRCLRYRIWLTIVGLAILRASVAHGAAPGVYVQTRIDGVINPIKVRRLQRALTRANQEHARFLLLTIDTPGGLVSSMQEMVSAISNAKLPVVAYVEPRSAQASSAGSFIVLACDVAAMAPETRIGSAHPVAQGKALEGPMDDKVTNSLSALVESLAKRRGRPVDDAVAMVRKSVSYTAEQAKQKGLIDVIAVDRADLLNKLDGRKLEGGKTLMTRGLEPVEVRPSMTDRILDRIADPTLSSLLLSLGALAILYELSTPGIGAAGAIGGISLVLGFWGNSILPIDLSALILMLIGLAAIALEIKVPTHGVLAGVGIVSLVIAGMFVVDPTGYFGGVPKFNGGAYLPIVTGSALGLWLLIRAARRALRAPQQTGLSAMVGKHGFATTSFSSESEPRIGQVFVDGARWSAESSMGAIKKDEPVEVTAVQEHPTRLVVRRKEEGNQNG